MLHLRRRRAVKDQPISRCRGSLDALASQGIFGSSARGLDFRQLRQDSNTHPLGNRRSSVFRTFKADTFLLIATIELDEKFS
jgi:hypothetical protein